MRLKEDVSMNFAPGSFLPIKLAAPIFQAKPRLEEPSRTRGSAFPILLQVGRVPLAVSKKLQVTRAGLCSGSFDDTTHTPCSSADWIPWRRHHLRRRIQSFC